MDHKVEFFYLSDPELSTKSTVSLSGLSFYITLYYRMFMIWSLGYSCHGYWEPNMSRHVCHHVRVENDFLKVALNVCYTLVVGIDVDLADS